MSNIYEHEQKRVYIMVKTYPTPSKGYVETVCTAGITDTGEWIRLYPISYRYLEDEQKYSKYSWIEIAVRKNSSDRRIESYQPVMESIKILDKPKSKELQWREALSIVRPIANKSLCEIKKLQENKNRSLGIFKPYKVTDFYFEKEENASWTNEQAQYIQQTLLGPEIKELERIPYSFHYKFLCDHEGCTGHDLTIIDWEIYQAYRSWRHRYSNENILLAKIKQKWFEELLGEDRDSFFIVGNHNRWQSSFMVLSVFWPPKNLSYQGGLF